MANKRGRPATAIQPHQGQVKESTHSDGSTALAEARAYLVAVLDQSHDPQLQDNDHKLEYADMCTSDTVLATCEETSWALMEVSTALGRPFWPEEEESEAQRVLRVMLAKVTGEMERGIKRPKGT